MEMFQIEVPLRPMLPGETFIQRTITRCTTCGEKCPGSISKKDGQVYMTGKCPAHGWRKDRIEHDTFFFESRVEEKKGSGGCGCGTCHSSDGQTMAVLGSNALNPGGVEQLSSCTYLFEIVYDCNLQCPTCFTASPWSKGLSTDYVPFDEFVARVEDHIRRKGTLEILQLTGGEPTTHPEFCRLAKWAMNHPKILSVLVNTNGVRLAHDDQFLADVKAIYQHKKLWLYLQFDGTELAGQFELRNADLRKTRELAIERCKSFGLGIHLAMTVNRQNIDQVWKTAEFAMKHRNIIGITYQPMFRSGRYAGGMGEEVLSGGDVAMALIEYSNGMIIRRDVIPLTCGNPNCHLVSGLVYTKDGPRPIVRKLDPKLIARIMKDKIRMDPETLIQCGCEDSEVAEFLKKNFLTPPYGLMFLIKPFMSAVNWNEHRILSCCTHQGAEDGIDRPFCQHNFDPPKRRPRRHVPQLLGPRSLRVLN